MLVDEATNLAEVMHIFNNDIKYVDLELDTRDNRTRTAEREIAVAQSIWHNISTSIISFHTDGINIHKSRMGIRRQSYYIIIWTGSQSQPTRTHPGHAQQQF